MRRQSERHSAHGRRKHGKWTKQRIVTIIACVLLVCGIGVFSYPYIEEAFYRGETAAVIDDFKAEVAQRQAEQRKQPDDSSAGGTDDSTEAPVTPLDELYAQMTAYNEDLYATGQEGLVDPFSYQQPSFDLTQFGFAENVVGYLDIPRMNVTLPIYLGATTKNMAKGAVHLSETSLPIGGENTNCVIAAHRGYKGGAMFRNIEDLQIGDEITVTNFRETLTYRVAELKVILPSDINEVLIQPGRDLITLVTCHPYRHNYQRYVVYCERVQDEGAVN